MPGPLTSDLPPHLPSDMPQESNPNHSESLRDRMLRQPESENIHGHQVKETINFVYVIGLHAVQFENIG